MKKKLLIVISILSSCEFLILVIQNHLKNAPNELTCFAPC